MTDIDELFLKVCDVLYNETSGRGMCLTEAIKKAAIDKKVDTTTKNKIRKKLVELSYKKREYVYCVDKEGVRCEESLPRGARQYWIVKSKPNVLSKDRRVLIFSLVKKYSGFFLPPGEVQVIDELCSAQLHAEPAWLKKLTVDPRYPALFPNYDTNIYKAKEELVMNALQQNKGFNANYLKTGWKHYFPVKLVRREWVSYIICQTSDENDTFAREYAIHRFRFSSVGSEDTVENVDKTELIKRKPTIPAKTSFVENVSGHWGMLTKLRLQIFGPPAQHLSEMRFHSDVRDLTLTKVLDRKPKDGSRLDEVTLEIRNVKYDHTFKTWLLGLGAYCKILSFEAEDKNIDPLRDLREDVKKMIEYLK